jgi:hypothetical protein
MNLAQTPQLQHPFVFFSVFFAGGLFEVDEFGLFIGDFERPGIGEFPRTGPACA